MMKYNLYTFIFLAFLLAGCNNVPGDDELINKRILFLFDSEKAESINGNEPLFHAPTMNFNLRNPSFIILHHTEEPDCEAALQKLTHPGTGVSAHYLICKDGTIYQLVPDHARAWHAGVSRWGAITDMNSVSLGIELDNYGSEPFPDVQIESLVTLLKTLRERYAIPPQHVLGHSEIAPGRKTDPHCKFPWQTLADEGLVMMPDKKTLPNRVPDYFEPLYALRIIGYDISHPEEAINVFRKRFFGCSIPPDTGLLTNEEIPVLYQIYEMSLR